MIKKRALKVASVFEEVVTEEEFARLTRQGISNVVENITRYCHTIGNRCFILHID